MKQVVVLLVCLLQWTVKSQVCELCADGSTPSVDLDAVQFTDRDLDVSCRSLQTAMSVLEATDVACIGYQELTAVYCGCPRPESSCTLCPDGSMAPDPDKEIMLDDQTTATCRDYVTAAPGTPESACSLVQTTIGVGQCGCPAVSDPQDAGCSICPTGSEVSIAYPDRAISGVKCSVFEAQVPMEFAFLPELCRSVQLTSGLYCGCPDMDLTTETNVCRLCGANQELQNLDALVTIESSSGVSDPLGFEMMPVPGNSKNRRIGGIAF